MHTIAALQLYLKHEAVKLNCYCFVLTGLGKSEVIPRLLRSMRTKTPPRLVNIGQVGSQIFRYIFMCFRN